MRREGHDTINSLFVCGVLLGERIDSVRSNYSSLRRFYSSSSATLIRLRFFFHSGDSVALFNFLASKERTTAQQQLRGWGQLDRVCSSSNRGAIRCQDSHRTQKAIPQTQKVSLFVYYLQQQTNELLLAK